MSYPPSAGFLQLPYLPDSLPEAKEFFFLSFHLHPICQSRSVLILSFLVFFYDPHFLIYWSVLVVCHIFATKKRPFRNFHSKWPYLLQRQEAFGSLMFYFRSDPEPAFLICVYRYKYKSHNHINTRYCWRQSHFFYILYLDHSKIYDIYSSKTPFVFYKMSQRFFLYRTTITKQINTAKFPNIENISSHNGWLKYPIIIPMNTNTSA